jgi:DNA ligase 1
MALPTLYTKDKSGAVRQWQIEAVDGRVVTSHGLLGGTQVTEARQCEPKNTGKRNATTAQQQAEKEAVAEHGKKLRHKYYLSPDEIPAELLLPMLAHNGVEHPEYIKYPCHVQPKLDGFRCLAVRRADGRWDLLSRKGLPLHVQHVSDALGRLDLPVGCQLDGELYSHGVPFQTLAAWIKNPSRPEHAQIHYHVYDAPSPEPWRFRCSLLDTVTTSLNVVPTCRVESVEELLQREETFISQGYEGLMVRNLDGRYTHGHRSCDLLKVKRFEDGEFRVVAATEETPGSGLVMWVCAHGGAEFEVQMCGTDEDRRKLYQRRSQYIGRLLTVKFFGWTEGGKPRHAKGKCFRPVADIP